MLQLSVGRRRLLSAFALLEGRDTAKAALASGWSQVQVRTLCYVYIAITRLCCSLQCYCHMSMCCTSLCRSEAQGGGVAQDGRGEGWQRGECSCGGASKRKVSVLLAAS